MALGGGTFLAKNKVLPGSYINFVSASKATAALSDRGIAAMPIEMDWGMDGEVFSVTPEELQKESLKLFGYEYTNEKLKGLRDLMKNVRMAYLYRLNAGVKASNDFASAKYSGTRGNDIKVIIAENVDDSTAFDVKTLFGTKEVDAQTVKTAAELKDNDYVVWKKDAALAATAGTALSGGTNKDAVTGDDYQTFLDKIESFSFNTMGCLSKENVICGLFTQFTKRMRDEVGMKFQTVLYKTAADYEGVISVGNKTTDEGWPESSAVYWVTGAEAGCDVNKSRSNEKYDGEFTIDAAYKQSELEAALKAGTFTLHKVGDEVRVLEDINTFVSVSDEKSADFSSNQTVRVLDQIGNDIAAMFNTKYLGKVPNDNAGRIALWNDIVRNHQELQRMRAIEDFKSDDVAVEAGDTKKAVVVTDRITPVSSMTQLYMTVVVE